MFGIKLPGLPTLPIGLPGLPIPGLNLPLPPIPGVNMPIPGLPPIPGLNLPLPKIGGDQVQVGAPQPAGGGAPGAADIDNVNLDPQELRALDNLMQNYLADGKFTPEEQKSYQEIRSLFARTPVAAGGPNPTGGGVPSTPTPSTPTPSTPPAPSTPWPVGTNCVDGRGFSSVGDPHETTGDGLKFDNMKDGTFIKAKSASGDFELQTTQGKDTSGRWPGATLNQKAAVKSGNDVVAYDGLAKTMTINGKATPIPANGQTIALPGGGSVRGTGAGVEITTAKGDKVNIKQQDHYIDVTGEIGKDRKDGEVRGALGAFDSDKSTANDLLGRTGSQPIGNPNNAADRDKFMEEWRVKPGEDLTQANPTGGGGPVNNQRAQFEAEFDKMDTTQNGYLSGTEITPELRNAFPGKDRITKDEYVNFKMGQVEAAAKAADEAEFAKRDVNKDGQLDGNEVGDAAKYDKGGNWVRPDGSSKTEISKEEFMAGRAADRAAAPAGGAANPVGGGVPTEAAAPPPAIAKARKAKRKHRHRNWFQRLTHRATKMAGQVFQIHRAIATAPLRALGLPDPFAGIKLF